MKREKTLKVVLKINDLIKDFQSRLFLVLLQYFLNCCLGVVKEIGLRGTPPELHPELTDHVTRGSLSPLA